MKQPQDPVEGATDLVALVGEVTRELDPGTMTREEVRQAVDALGAVRRLVDGAITLLARRLTDEDDAPRERRQAIAALATSLGTSSGVARATIEASRQVADQPDMHQALRAGALSGDQARIIAETVEHAPEATAALLAAAREQTVQDLRATARQVRHEADIDPDQTRRRHHHRRSMRTWQESDGEWHALVRGPADAGARFEAALRATHDAVFRAARGAGNHEPSQAHRFDALLALVEAGAQHSPAPTPAEATPTPANDDDPARQATRPAATTAGASDQTRHDTTSQYDASPNDASPNDASPNDASPNDASSAPPPRTTSRTARQTKVIIRVDGAALVRDSLEPGEMCDLAGFGPISLQAAKLQIPDAHLAYVITRGAAVDTVVHLGRQVTAHQRTALEARGYRCEVPHCRSGHLLEIDHVTGWAINHETRLDDLAWLCPHHHDQKTCLGHRLHGPPGRRRWLTRDGQVIAEDPP